jgi:hypothetical protein
MHTKSELKRGRPSKFSAEIAEKIWDELVEGKSLRAICADPRMPAKATVYRWLARDQEFRRSYVLARDFAAEWSLELIMYMAHGATEENIEDVKRQIGALKMTLGRMAPKKYFG